MNRAVTLAKRCPHGLDAPVCGTCVSAAEYWRSKPPLVTTTHKVRIKPGTRITQDRAFGSWPSTASGQDVDPNMVFQGRRIWNGWECQADGFGHPGKYGNGAISVVGEDGVEVIG